MSAAIKAVEDTTDQINSLSTQFDAVSVAVRNQLQKDEGIATQLQEYFDKIDNLEKALAYLHRVKTIEDIR